MAILNLKWSTCISSDLYSLLLLTKTGLPNLCHGISWHHPTQGTEFQENFQTCHHHRGETESRWAMIVHKITGKTIRAQKTWRWGSAWRTSTWWPGTRGTRSAGVGSSRSCRSTTWCPGTLRPPFGTGSTSITLLLRWEIDRYDRLFQNTTVVMIKPGCYHHLGLHNCISVNRQGETGTGWT